MDFILLYITFFIAILFILILIVFGFNFLKEKDYKYIFKEFIDEIKRNTSNIDIYDYSNNTNKNDKRDNPSEKVKTNEYNYFTKLKEKIKNFESEKERRKRFFNENRKNRYKKHQKENKKKGNLLEIETGKVLEKQGYNVIYHGLEKGMKDKGIDVIAENNDSILLIQCKNWNFEKYKIKEEHIIKFHKDSRNFEKTLYTRKKIKPIYVVQDKRVLSQCAINTLDYYNYNYEIIEV